MFFDMKIYHGAMVWWANGHPLYEFVAPQTTLGFTYPPFAALLMLPMATLNVPMAALLNLLASLTALTVVLIALLRPVAARLDQPLWFVVALAVPLAAALEPVRETLGFGQVNLLLFALVMADLVALRLRAKRGPAAGPAERADCAGSSSAVPGPGSASGWRPPSSSPRRSSSSI